MSIFMNPFFTSLCVSIASGNLCALLLWNVCDAADRTHSLQLPPPEAPPPGIVNALVMGGQIPLEFLYVDDSNGGRGTHFKYSEEDILLMIERAREMVKSAANSPIPPPPAQPEGSKTVRMSDIWLIHALLRYPVKDKSVVVYGSMTPWYESIALAFGAKSVTVVEYNKLTYSHSAITTLQPHELPDNATFDSVMSISSFDHDGLGRYGDPINPNGDLDAMRQALSVLKPGGRMFLTVPIGKYIDLCGWYSRISLLSMHIWSG
jgi:hypothetical protein